MIFVIFPWYDIFFCDIFMIWHLFCDISMIWYLLCDIFVIWDLLCDIFVIWHLFVIFSWYGIFFVIFSWYVIIFLLVKGFGRKSNYINICHLFRVFLSGPILIFFWYSVFIYVIYKLFWVIIVKFQVIIFHFFGQNRFAIFSQKMKNITWNFPISPKKFTYHIKKTKYHKKSWYDH